jgi:uncharacterized protein (TIGR01244 family)
MAVESGLAVKRFACSIIAVLGAGLGMPVTAQVMNETSPLPGVTSAGQPDREALAELADEGYVTVIDLRGENEDRGFDEAEAVEELGMRYVSLPVIGPDDVNYENAAALDSLIRDASGPVLIHCGSGNRVGALLSLRQRLIGDDAETALAIGLAAGLSSQVMKDTVASRLAER